MSMFVGSGAIEAACKMIVTQRAKQSGMHRTVSGAASIIALRCQQASGRWDELWTPQLCQPGTSQTANGHLADNTTQTPRPEPPPRSSPTNPSCTPSQQSGRRTSGT
jgi:hypothetical protein